MVDNNRNIYLAGQLQTVTGEMNSNDFLLVKFKELATNELALSRLGTGSGSVAFNPGTNCTGTCSQFYLPGTQVTLTATPDTDSTFTGWSGACSGTDTCTVAMDGNKQVAATFVRKFAIYYSSLGTGTGTVTFVPGTSCSNNCSQSFDTGAQVTLTATPDADSIFTGWSGACTGTGPCTVTVDGDRQVSASFVKKFAISYSRLGTGTGTVAFVPGTSCSDNCSQFFDTGTQVVLTATPDADSLFTGWSGACTGTGTCTVTMDGDRQVSASFVKKFAISYRRLGTGAGTVAFVPGTSCSKNCSQSFDTGTQVTLTAIPDANSQFIGWGDACLAMSTCTVLMDGNKAVSARFDSTSVPSIAAKAALAAGASHSVALRDDGTVWTWGINAYGQLGDGSNTQKIAPAQLPVLSSVTAIAAGDFHTLALKIDGTVWAWGDNSSGQLGDGTTTHRQSPIQVSGLSDVIAIAGGSNHSLAVKSDGTVWTWGNNAYGQLGDGTTTQRLTPVMITGLSEMSAVAGGFYFSAALKKDGTVWAWGIGSLGQLGDGTNAQRNSPVQVPGVGGVVNLTTGWNYIMAATESGSLRAWGHNLFGQLGDGTTTQRSSAITVPGVSAVAATAAKGTTTVSLKNNGTVWAWGKNDYGQLGDGTTTQRSVPTNVSGLSNVAVVAAGQTHFLALKNDGTIWSWGENRAGQLGDGTTTGRLVPTQVTGLNLDVTAPTTTANPPGGTFGSPQTVILTTSEPATIYYTLDGSPPTTASSVYGGPITISASTTLNYFAKDAAGNWETVKTQEYTINVTPPSADFSSSVITGFSPLTVTFTDLSTGPPTSWSWDFGDATTSSSQNPVHTYNTPGSYSVSLTATNGGGTSSVTKTSYITVLCLGPSRLQPEYDTAPDGAVLRMRTGETNEDITLNRDISVTISGGYDCSEQTSAGVTTVRGTLTIVAGAATLENLALQ